MKTSTKKVVILDDDDQIRSTLETRLKIRGFEVQTFGDYETIKEALSELDDISVAILDMELDAQGPAPTGVDLGRIWKNAVGYPPEFLIFSGYEKTEYYQKALNLGVAGYLLKSITSSDELICVVRSLYLKWSLAANHRQGKEKVARLAAMATNTHGIMLLYCHFILLQELESCLGNPFFLYYNGGLNQHVIYPDSITLDSARLEQDLNKFLHDPLVRPQITEFPDRQEINPDLRGTTLLHLFHDQEIHLYLGVQSSEKCDKYRTPDNTTLLVQSLNRYLGSTIFEQIHQLQTIILSARSRNEGLLLGTAGFCQQASRLLLYRTQTISQARIRGDEARIDDLILEISQMARQMQEIGFMLDQLGQEHGGQAQTCSARSLIETIREDSKEKKTCLTHLHIEGDAQLWGNRAHLDYALSGLLEWMAARENQGEIRVQLLSDQDSVKMVIQDQSQRLSPELRDLLFSPMALPIESETRVDQRSSFYLVRAFLQHNGATLTDTTDQLADALGHQFTFCFPATQIIRGQGGLA